MSAFGAGAGSGFTPLNYVLFLNQFHIFTFFYFIFFLPPPIFKILQKVYSTDFGVKKPSSPIVCETYKSVYNDREGCQYSFTSLAPLSG